MGCIGRNGTIVPAYTGYRARKRDVEGNSPASAGLKLRSAKRGRVSRAPTLNRLETGSEVAQELGGIGEAEAAQRSLVLADLGSDAHHVVQVGLGIYATGDGQAHELEGGVLHDAGMWMGVGEHDRADFASADATLAIEFNGQCLPGEFTRRDVGEERSSIDIDSMTTRWLDDGDPGLLKVVSQVGSLAYLVCQVILIQAFT